jgi:hypothetical protein
LVVFCFAAATDSLMQSAVVYQQFVLVDGVCEFEFDAIAIVCENRRQTAVTNKS